MGKLGISQQAEAALVQLKSGVRQEENLAKLPQKLGVSLDSKGSLIFPSEIQNRLESLDPEVRQSVDQLLQKIILEQQESQRPKGLLERFFGVLNNSAKGLSHTLEATLRVTLGNIYQLVSTAIGLGRLENPMEIWVHSGNDYKQGSKYVFDNFFLGSVYPQENVLAKMGKLERIMLSNPLAHLSSAIFDPLYDGIDFLKNELRRGIMNSFGGNLDEKQFLELAKTDPLLRISSFAFNIAQGSLMLVSILCGNFQGVARLTRLLASSGTFSLVSSIGNQLLHKEETDYLELVEGTVDQMAKSLTFSGGLRLLGAKHAALGTKIDFVDAQGDLSAAAVQFSNEVEKLKSWEELKERKVQRRLTGAGLLGLTSAYDAVDAKVTGILDFSANNLDSKSEAIDDVAKLLSLDPKALEELRTSLSSLTADMWSFPQKDNLKQIHHVTETLCLLGKKLKSISPELDLVCRDFYVALLINKDFKNITSLEAALRFSAEEKSEIYKKYCLLEIERCADLGGLSPVYVRGLLLAVGVALRNDQVLEDLGEVSITLAKSHRMDPRTYYILEAKKEYDPVNAIMRYLSSEGATWPLLENFIIETLDIFEVDDPEMRNKIFADAQSAYFTNIHKGQVRNLAHDIFWHLNEKKEIPEEVKNKLVLRVLECFDIATLSILEENTFDSLCEKTASGHWINLAAINSLKDVFSNFPNIPGAVESVGQTLLQLDANQKRIIIQGLARVLVCCEDGVVYAESIVNLLGLSNSDILREAAQEAVLCCYDLGRDKTIPVKLRKDIPLTFQTADINYYRKKVREIFQSRKLNFSTTFLDEEAKSYAYFSALNSIIEIAQMPIALLFYVIEDRIGFALHLTQGYLAGEDDFLIRQSAIVFDQSKWPEKDNFYPFHENLIKTAYLIAAMSDLEEEFNSLFSGIFILPPAKIKQCFEDILNLALSERFNVKQRLIGVLKCFMHFAFYNSLSAKEVHEQIDRSLKEGINKNILDQLWNDDNDDQNPFVALNIFSAYRTVFTEEQAQILLEEVFVDLVNSIKNDLNDHQNFSARQLERLRGIIVKYSRIFCLSTEFKNRILERLEN